MQRSRKNHHSLQEQEYVKQARWENLEFLTFLLTDTEDKSESSHSTISDKLIGSQKSTTVTHIWPLIQV